MKRDSERTQTEGAQTKGAQALAAISDVDVAVPLFAALFDAAAFSMQIFDADGRCVYANPAWSNIWGPPPALVVGYNILNDPQVDAVGILPFVRQVFTGRTTFIPPTLYDPQKTPGNPEGKARWCSAQASALCADSGNVIWVMFMHEDVTDRVETEFAMAEKEALFEAAFEQSNDAIFLHDLEGRFIRANQRALQLFGLPEDKLDRFTIRDIHPAEVLEASRQQVETLKREGSVRFESVMRQQDGSLFPGEVSATIIDLGDRKLVQGLVRDLSERKKAEEQLSLLYVAVMQSDEPIMLLDEHGVVELANPAAAAVYGREAEALIGTPVAELRGGSVGDALYREVIARLQQGEPWHGEFKLAHAEGERTLARRVSPVLDAKGRMYRQIIVDRDITDERSRQKKMEHVQRLESLGVLAGGIAHDFNNLLTAIMGNAALMVKHIPDHNPAHENVRQIEETSRRAADLCKQMLAYSGKGKFVVKPIILSDLVDELSQLLRVSIAKNIVLRLDLNRQIPAVDVDVTQMQQVIMNLVINASEAIGEKSGAISIATGVLRADRDYLATTFMDSSLAEGRYVYLEVSDTGCGMDQATKAKIFEPFFTTKFTGRGLGMSAILGIVRGHKGAIKVYSEPGKGTTFKVLLPCSAKQSVAINLERNDAAGWRGKGCILIVDDEETIREVAASMLEDMGFETLAAADGIEGVEMFRTHRDRISAVLLDMTMPRMGGEDAYSEMCRIDPDVNVILSSGYNEQDATNRFAGKGLAGFIQKPYTPDELAAKMKALFDKT